MVMACSNNDVLLQYPLAEQSVPIVAKLGAYLECCSHARKKQSIQKSSR